MTGSVPERSVSSSRFDLELERTCDLRRLVSSLFAAMMFEGMSLSPKTCSKKAITASYMMRWLMSRWPAKCRTKIAALY